MDNMIQDIVRLAKHRHLSQNDLAAAAQIQPAALSRAKRTGSANIRLVSALASAAGLRLDLVDAQAGRLSAATRIAAQPNASSFEAHHRVLAWSNPKADRETLIRRALVRPAFDALLDAALAIGIEQLEVQWRYLLESDDPEAHQARSATDAILQSIRHGYEQAAA